MDGKDVRGVATALRPRRYDHYQSACKAVRRNTTLAVFEPRAPARNEGNRADRPLSAAQEELLG